MTPRKIKKILKPLLNTPLHPQWQPRTRNNHFSQNFSTLSGSILDIGCGERTIRNSLPPSAQYIGLDYFRTATTLYQTRPDVFGDGQHLPFADHSFDHILLLDVLEHIPSPAMCLDEIYRVLKPGGSLLIQVPFIYPIHDAPFDFHRWTRFGLEMLAKNHGFYPAASFSLGRPTDTSALISNLALSKLLLNLINNKSPFIIFALFIPPAIFMNNIISFLLSLISPEDDFMPRSYQAIWKPNGYDTKRD